MTKEEYAEYEIAVQWFFEREGLIPSSLSDKPAEDTNCPNCYSDNIMGGDKDGEICCNECDHTYFPKTHEGCIEPYFSWYACDVCDRREGGDRYEMIGWNETEKQIFCYAVCADCAYYVEYGRLDDMTMLNMEDEK